MFLTLCSGFAKGDCQPDTANDKQPGKEQSIGKPESGAEQKRDVLPLDKEVKTKEKKREEDGTKAAKKREKPATEPKSKKEKSNRLNDQEQQNDKNDHKDKKEKKDDKKAKKEAKKEQAKKDQKDENKKKHDRDKSKNDKNSTKEDDRGPKNSLLDTNDSKEKKKGKGLKFWQGKKLDDQSAKDGQKDKQTAKQDNSKASNYKAVPEVQLSQRARAALDDFYEGKPPSAEQYLIDLKRGDRNRAQEALFFLEAYLHQALDDEAKVRRNQGTRRLSADQSIAARSAIHAAIFRTGTSLAGLPLVLVLAEDMLPTADGAAAFIISEVSGADAVPVYTKILNRPYTSGLLTAAVLKRVGRDNLQQFSQKVKEFANHYRTSVRQSARDAAASLRLEGIAPYDESAAITPWFESQIIEVGRLRDGQEKMSDIPEMPAQNATLTLAADYLSGKRKESTHAIIEKLNSLADDRLFFLQTRDDLFIAYYKAALRQFTAGNYKNCERICSYLTAGPFAGTPLVANAKAVMSQLSDRATDSTSFVLPTESEWSEKQKKSSLKDQVDFLTPRLRLLKAKQQSGPLLSRMAVAQTNSAGQPVINPLVQLRRLVTEPGVVPLLFPYINDQHFCLTVFERSGTMPSLPTVGELVAQLINDSVQFEMIPNRYWSLEPKDQSALLAQQEKWCKQHPHAAGKELAYAVASVTKDAKVYTIETQRLKQSGDARLAALLNKRFGEFPGDVEREAELLFDLGGSDAIKRAESVLKQPAVSVSTADRGLSRQSKERTQSVRFWFTLLLLNEHSSAGMGEVKRLAALSVSDMPAAVRINLPRLVEALMKQKTPEAQAVAGTFVDKFADRLSPEAVQVLEAAKTLFVYGAEGSYDRLVRWVELEPVRPSLLAQLEEWLGVKPNSATNGSDAKARLNEIKTKLQEEFAALKAGKPSRLKPAGS